MLSLLALCILGGSLVGLLSGMFGVGGAFIIIPLLDEILIRMGMDPGTAHVMAVGTSPSTILFTCIASFLTHRRLGSVRFDILRRMLPGLFAGSVAGAYLAPLVSTLFLKLLFYGIVVVTSLRMIFPPKRFEQDRERLRFLELVALAFGMLASMSGVAGTMLNLSYLNWRGVPWTQCVGTVSAIGLLLASTATLGFVGSGWGVPDLPDWSVGYVYLPGTLCLIVPSMIMARVGAWLTHWKRLPLAVMKRLVALGLLTMSVSVIAKLLFFS